jgi:hypothetical protein
MAVNAVLRQEQEVLDRECWLPRLGVTTHHIGTGAIARRLAPLVDRVDAVDFSSAMIEAGRQLPNGDHAHLRWVEGDMEQVMFDPLMPSSLQREVYIGWIGM